MNYQYTDQKRWEELQRRLKTSPFRSRFKLGERELAYLAEKGGRTIGRQAEKFIVERLSPAAPRNDGKQTPMRGHPVFIAQHATALCCRSCAEKWHGIPRGRPMTAEEIRWAVFVLCSWIRMEGASSEKKGEGNHLYFTPMLFPFDSEENESVGPSCPS